MEQLREQLILRGVPPVQLAKLLLASEVIDHEPGNGQDAG